MSLSGGLSEGRPNAPYILTKSNTAVTRNSANAAGDATEQTMATITLPAGLLTGETSIHIHAMWSATSSANTKTYTVRLSSTSIGSHSSTTTVSNQTSLLCHANGASAQKFVNNAVADFSGAGALGSSAKNANTALSVTLGCNWAGATLSESISLESYFVMVYPG